MSEASSVSLQILLALLARQLQQMAHVGNQIEDAVGRCIAKMPAESPTSSTLQGLDNLIQSLSGVATYVDRLAQDVDPHHRVDARQAATLVKQSSLAATLMGLETERTEPGTADFF